MDNSQPRYAEMLIVIVIAANAHLPTFGTGQVVLMSLVNKKIVNELLPQKPVRPLQQKYISSLVCKYIIK